MRGHLVEWSWCVRTPNASWSCSTARWEPADHPRQFGDTRLSTNPGVFVAAGWLCQDDLLCAAPRSSMGFVGAVVNALTTGFARSEGKWSSPLSSNSDVMSRKSDLSCLLLMSRAHFH